MVRWQFSDGHTASIWERWVELSPRYLAFWNRWDPGALAVQHGHTGDHSVLVLRGELRVGDVVCTAGTHIMLEWGDVFGPMEAGPEGCELYGFIAGEGSPFAGDRAAFEKLLVERGAVAVPLPRPKRLPPWKRATYSDGSVTNWTAEEDEPAE